MSELHKAMKWATFQEGGGQTISQEEVDGMSLVSPIRPIANIMDPLDKRRTHPKKRPKRGKPKQKPERPDKGG